jgi:hypothetical protein
MRPHDALRYGGPSLSIQARAVGSAGASGRPPLHELFFEEAARAGIAVVIVKSAPSLSEESVFRARARMTWDAEADIPATVATWHLDGDDALVLNVPLSAFRQVGVVPPEFIEAVVATLRGVHRRMSLRAALIGHEATAASRLLELWSTSNMPGRGSPGSLWPDGTELEWFPLTEEVRIESDVESEDR